MRGGDDDSWLSTFKVLTKFQLVFEQTTETRKFSYHSTRDVPKIVGCLLNLSVELSTGSTNWLEIFDFSSRLIARPPLARKSILHRASPEVWLIFVVPHSKLHSLIQLNFNQARFITRSVFLRAHGNWDEHDFSINHFSSWNGSQQNSNRVPRLRVWLFNFPLTALMVTSRRWYPSSYILRYQARVFWIIFHDHCELFFNPIWWNHEIPLIANQERSWTQTKLWTDYLA